MKFLFLKNDDETKNVHEEVSKLLDQIPAGIPYDDWFHVAAALKKEGCTLEDFISWSSTCPEKYDQTACERTWEAVAAPGKPSVTLGTLKMLASKYAAAPVRIEPLPCPETPEAQMQQAVDFIRNLFQDGDAFELVSQSRIGEKGRRIPCRRKENIHQLPISDEDLKRIVMSAYYSAQEGVWFTFNPIRKEIQGKSAADADVTDLRYVLVEADELDKEEQLEKLAALHLPVKAVTWSGNKSVHVLVRIDAGKDLSLYVTRVKALYDYLVQAGFPVDQANKNPARLSRMPGFQRGENVQYLLAQESGPASWTDFETRFLQRKEDRRKETSPLNGLLGGRPQIPVTDIATQFFQSLKGSDSLARLRIYDEGWWLYDEGVWKNITRDDLRKELMGYMLQNKMDGLGRLGVAAVNDIFLNLESTTLAGLSKLKYTMPCWLSDRSSGEGFMRFSNGILNVKQAIASDSTPELLPLTPDFFSDKMVAYDFDPEAQCPKWMEYLETTFSDPEMRTAMQMLFGYILSGETSLNIAFFFVGDGGGGKSTAAHVLKHMIGEDNTCRVTFQQLGSKFDQYALTQNLLNLCEDLNTADSMGNIGTMEETFKTITDGSSVSTERKFRDPGSAPARARCVFCTNAMPPFKDRSKGLWDRIVIIPFKKRFRGERDEKKDFKADLVRELSGIVNWALAGARMLKKYTRFPLPEASRRAREMCRLENDHAQLFLQEHVYEDPNETITLQNLYDNFSKWLQDNGFRAISQPKFNKSVMERFPHVRKGRVHSQFLDLMAWRGINCSNTCLVHEFSDEEPLQEIPAPRMPWEREEPPAAVPASVPEKAEEAPEDTPEAVPTEQETSKEEMIQLSPW